MTKQATISPPAASTAGTIARSEPPVVRMSSTRSTRSPGSIRKPRRNSRCVVPVGVADLLGEDAADAELAGGLEGEDDPAGRRAGDDVDERRAVLPPRAAAAQKPHSSLVTAGSWRSRNFSR